LFKESGKWYADGSVDMSPAYNAACLHDGLYVACARSQESGDGWPLSTTPYAWLMSGGTIVCLDPYHQHAHPVMLTSETAKRNPFAEVKVP
jgi:hypothetical protein